MPETPVEVPETPVEVPETPVEVPETPVEVPETPQQELPWPPPAEVPETPQVEEPVVEEPVVEEPVVEEPVVEEPVVEEPVVEVPPPAPARLNPVGSPIIAGRNATFTLQIHPGNGLPQLTARDTMMMYIVYNADGSTSSGILPATWDPSRDAHIVTVDVDHDIEPCDGTSVQLRHPESGAVMTAPVDFSWQYGC